MNTMIAEITSLEECQINTKVLELDMERRTKLLNAVTTADETIIEEI